METSLSFSVHSRDAEAPSRRLQWRLIDHSTDHDRLNNSVCTGFFDLDAYTLATALTRRAGFNRVAPTGLAPNISCAVAHGMA
jgi:hypothetical protein